MDQTPLKFYILRHQPPAPSPSVSTTTSKNATANWRLSLGAGVGWGWGLVSYPNHSTKHSKYLGSGQIIKCEI